MTEYLIICLVSFFASGLTLFSGFGLGTLLLPVFAVFFPLQVAIAATAVVHLVNNLFKVFLVGKKANKDAIIRFSVPAVFAAMVGAALLSSFSLMPKITSYYLWNSVHEITAVKLTIGVLIIVFSLMEILPQYANMSFGKQYLPLGGLLSGFFGGLIGNQGALRSMFLIRSGLDKDEFIGTSVVTSVIVDTARLMVYGAGFYWTKITVLSGLGGLVATAILSAFLGSLLANDLAKKATLGAVSIIVALMLVLIGALISTGLI